MSILVCSREKVHGVVRRSHGHSNLPIPPPLPPPPPHSPPILTRPFPTLSPNTSPLPHLPSPLPNPVAPCLTVGTPSAAKLGHVIRAARASTSLPAFHWLARSWAESAPPSDMFVKPTTATFSLRRKKRKERKRKPAKRILFIDSRVRFPA